MAGKWPSGSMEVGEVSDRQFLTKDSPPCGYVLKTDAVEQWGVNRCAAALWFSMSLSREECLHGIKYGNRKVNNS